jgi:hypothetical protein
MKHLLRLSIFAALLMVLVLPLTAAAAPVAYREGIDVYLARGYTIAHINLDLRATKLVDGGYRNTEIDIEFNDYFWTIDQTVVLPGDPDNLDVSRDLGWGGLDGVVWVWRQNRETGVRERIPVEFHLDLYATASNSTYGGGYFNRRADVQGTVKIGTRTIEFNMPPGSANYEVGYNFSDQWPGR